MLRRSLVRTMIAAGLLCALSCSFVIETSDVDQGCGSGKKLCAGKCVEQSDKRYGCTRTGCDPCRLTNAIPACAGEECVVDACLLGFGCADEKVGCPTNILVNHENCGSCWMPCHGSEICSDGTCIAGQAGSGN